MLSKRLAKSWNGFSQVIDSEEYPSRSVSIRRKEEYEDSLHDMNNMPRQNSTTHARQALRHDNIPKIHSLDDRKQLKMPKTFPGVNLSEYNAQKDEEMAAKKLAEAENKLETKLTLDDVEKVLTLHKKRTTSVAECRVEKLPKIKVSKVDVGMKPSSDSLQAPSHAFNCARMLTELNEVCSFKAKGSVGQEVEPVVCEENLLRLKTVHDARRYSSFTPRRNIERLSPIRWRSVPNLNSRELPKRYFVKLDPRRASATPINLSSWNQTSRHCRILSEYLRELDTDGIERTKEQRDIQIGQWIRETCQSGVNDFNDLNTEVEAS